MNYPIASIGDFFLLKKYLNEGNFQALFEFIPTITGLDQGFFIPSINIMYGLRHNLNGFEFAFGPNLTLTKSAEGYFDKNNAWNLNSEWNPKIESQKNPFEIKKRLDSHGEYRLKSGFVFAFGKIFKSGRLNIPVNAFFVPGKKDSHHFGISMDFNTTK